ncbi:MAG: MarR family winged helix-turn-helix transcriptional regulator [Clostridia bacterium]|nr:MarR family winged helix-turn-helix transcriptional regulator [Clostridia bacterium]
MLDTGITPIRVFSNAARFIEAYHRVLQPLCRESGLPPLAVDILMFAANNPEYATAKNICKYRGMKPSIVSVHVERLVGEGYLQRQEVPGDRRQTLLICTERAQPLIEHGRDLQRQFSERLTLGMSDADREALHKAMTLLDNNIEEIRKNGL